MLKYFSKKLLGVNFMHAISTLLPDNAQSYAEERNLKRGRDQSPEKEYVRFASFLGRNSLASPLKKRARLFRDCPSTTTFFATAHCVGSVFRELQTSCLLTPTTVEPLLAGPILHPSSFFGFNPPNTSMDLPLECGSMNKLEESEFSVDLFETAIDLVDELPQFHRPSTPVDVDDELPQFHRPSTPVDEDDELQRILQVGDEPAFDDQARFSLHGLAFELEKLERRSLKTIDNEDDVLL
jgi:hypothetical protein